MGNFWRKLKRICNFEITSGESKLFKKDFISHLSYATLNWDLITPFYLFKFEKVEEKSNLDIKRW